MGNALFKTSLVGLVAAIPLWDNRAAIPPAGWVAAAFGLVALAAVLVRAQRANDWRRHGL